ncbi:hypothetical protein BDP27DRAFT_1450038 [Rhodocollybia butyracea]|uniref:DUF6534 domain-containing protein n=1 Tax=Rhodocollybia butyracea TaxID=206335 RepID=A0A9P5PM78_9AGAR|nr:hypothetical protein BDP27DRAFT_1450038 [Rhodocollybia butyracea]
MSSLNLDNTFGAAFIGASVAGFLLGLSVFQAHIYFQYNNDKPIVRTLVGMVVFFDFVHQALILHTVYWYVVKNYYNPANLALVVWSLLAEVIFNGFAAVCVQSFLNWRIWRLSKFNIWATGTVAMLVFGEFGCVIAFGIIALVRVRTFEELAVELKGLSITVNALAAAGDVLIAAILSFLLQGSKTGFRRSDSMLNTLTLYAVNTGMLTSLCAVASLISIVAAPNTFIYIAFFFCMGRLYTNSLLATLNARKAIRERGDNVHSTIGGNFSLSFKSIAKPASSLLSWTSKHTPEDDPISTGVSVQVTREIRSQDYGRQTGSKNSRSEEEEEYELEESSVNLSHADLDSSISLPQKAHIEVV